MAEGVSQRPGAPPDRPGARLDADGVAFAVASRHAERISVCLFDATDRETARIRLAARNGDLHYGYIPGVGAGQRYGLRADGPWDPPAGHRFDPAKLLVDPYATRLDRPFAYDRRLTAPRARAVDTAGLVPKAIVEPARAPASAPTALETPGFIYEVCVKAHTIRDPDVPIALRGRLRGLAEPHVIERLVRLGVSHVELMPVAAWVDERHLPPLGLSNAWGYNPIVFMALDPRLAPGGVEDLRAVAAALAAAGIGLLLDVVYNHTGESDAFGPTLSLRGLDNALYYRHAADGAPINDAGCGNSLDCTQPVVVDLILDALRHFLNAGVAGFRFDLATSLARRPDGFDPRAPLLQAIAADPGLSASVLIAEPWDVGPGGYQVGRFPPPWREWNDRYRDDVRRFWRGDPHTAGAFATRLAGSSDLFGGADRAPSASVNYVAAHDGFSLRDLVSYAAKRNFANGEDNRDGAGGEISWNGGADGETSDTAVVARRKADIRALLATLFLSRGTPMLTAGDEFGRTQGGNNNAYAQDNETIWLDWASADPDLAGFCSALARLRRAVPVLTEDRFLSGVRIGDSSAPDAVWTRADGEAMQEGDWANSDFVGLTLAPTTNGGRAYLAFNRGPATEALPPGPAPGAHWRLALDSAAGFIGRQDIRDGRVHCAARSALLLLEEPRSGQ